MRRAVLVVVLSLLAVACGPESSRTDGGGLGADVGNLGVPVQMHGDQTRNNPSFDTPGIGRAPADARGVPGWWTGGKP